MSDFPIVVLLSIGRHPISGRARAAERDARALALALGFGRPVVGLHAGEPDEALREYLGMGLAGLTLLPVVPPADPAAVLAAHLKALAPDLVLAGARAESGDDTGLLPYLVADAIDAALIPGVVSAEPSDQGLSVLQAVPRGRRRRLAVTGRALLTVDRSGPTPRQVAWGPARRRQWESSAVGVTPAMPDLLPVTESERPARPRPKRIGPQAAQQSSGKAALTDCTPEAAAQAIFSFLVDQRVVRPPSRS
jgi:electron transfer flavoprotein beta subunit